MVLMIDNLDNLGRLFTKAKIPLLNRKIISSQDYFAGRGKYYIDDLPTDKLSFKYLERLKGPAFMGWFAILAILTEVNADWIDSFNFIFRIKAPQFKSVVNILQVRSELILRANADFGLDYLGLSQDEKSLIECWSKKEVYFTA
jgi:hypothetical protein